uniref:Ig-like domain-containing protein n=1 Tax=Myotis lucifugus TaxID=59463 RepID=G1Q7Z9_MYOLU
TDWIVREQRLVLVGEKNGAVSASSFGLSSQKMEQNPQSLSIQESEKAVLTCSYANYSPVFIQWYRQDPGRGPIFLLLIRENERTKLVGRLRATFDTTIKQSSFYITASQPADSATYLCAASTQQGPAAHFLHPNPANHHSQQSCWLC